MATYVTLIRFTEQGARNVGETRQRAAAFRDTAKKAGITVREQYWTMGSYDGLLVLDAPDEQSVTAAMAGLGALGNVRTQTMRAFDESEIGDILGRAGAGGSAASRGARGEGAGRRGR
jgi:uncharacterized protein with GYD domain